MTPLEHYTHRKQLYDYAISEPSIYGFLAILALCAIGYAGIYLLYLTAK